jgi:titin
VRAWNEVGNSAYSNCVSAKTAVSGTPKAPTNLNATSISASKIKLIWTDNSANETSFKVYRKVGAGTWSLLATKGTNIVGHTDTTAAGNTTTTTYSYYLQACNSNGCSPSTTWAVVPYKPTNLAATAASSSRINLAWADKSSNETGFQIERKSGGCSSTNSWSKIKTVGQNIISYGNSGLASGETYSYRIRAYKKSSAAPYAYGYSTYSNCKSATTP